MVVATQAAYAPFFNRMLTPLKSSVGGNKDDLLVALQSYLDGSSVCDRTVAPLSHPPGHGQADFGEAMVIIGGLERKVHFFVLDLPHSDGCYVRAYPAAVPEAWVDGHIHAFAFFRAVRQSIVYDNDRCLVATILSDGTRKRAALFSGFLSHRLRRGQASDPVPGEAPAAATGLVHLPLPAEDDGRGDIGERLYATAFCVWGGNA